MLSLTPRHIGLDAVREVSETSDFFRVHLLDGFYAFITKQEVQRILDIVEMNPDQTVIADTVLIQAGSTSFTSLFMKVVRSYPEAS